MPIEPAGKIKEEKVTPAPKPAAPVAEETISIPKTQFDQLISRLDKQEELIRSVADKSRLMNWDVRHQDTSLRTTQISTYNGKIVLGWKMLANEMYQDAKNLWHEDQQVEIALEGGATVKLTYLEFAKNLTKVVVEIVSKYSTPEGHNMYRVKYQDREIDIDQTFVN